MKLIRQLFLYLTFILPLNSLAGGIVRDSETENAFNMFNSGLEKINGYDNKDVVYRLVIDNDINAFVSGGKNIYYHSGLILSIKNVGQFMAVSAHEMAHITNGDLNKVGKAHDHAKKIGAIGTALSVVGGLATSSPDALFAGAALSNQLSRRTFFKYVRGQETSADLTSYKFFRKLKYSPKGIYEIQKILLDKSGYLTQNQIYEQTHPASQDRLEAGLNEYKNSPYKNNEFPDKWKKTFLRIQAKLFGYTNDRKTVFGKYPLMNQTDNAIYARAMYHFANKNSTNAIKSMKKLVNKYPDDIYYLDSYATVLALGGKYDKAIEIYKKILKKNRKTDMFWIEYARILIEKGGKDNLQEAEYSLYRAKAINPKESYTYRIMTGLYSKTKQEGKRLLARAEENLIYENPKAVELAKQAKKKLKKNSPEYNRAEDIILLMGGK